MKPLKSFIFITFFSTLTCFAQLEQGNFLVGGTANISNSSVNRDNEDRQSAFGIAIDPDIGYFILPKLAVGATINFSYSKPNNSGFSISYGIGPFVRYYFLDQEKLVNIFVDANYGIGFIDIDNADTQTRRGYQLSAGPTLFFNRSVALELALRYSYSDYSKNNDIGIILGFQIYLIKNN